MSNKTQTSFDKTFLAPTEAFSFIKMQPWCFGMAICSLMNVEPSIHVLALQQARDLCQAIIDDETIPIIAPDCSMLKAAGALYLKRLVANGVSVEELMKLAKEE